MSDLDFVNDASPDEVAAHITAIIGAIPEAKLAVPGGRTPGPVFTALAARNMKWGARQIWLTDDRCVPADHGASNYGLLKKHLGESDAQILALKEGANPPRFDLVWFGMGADGHIASLFPNMNPQPGGDPAVVHNTPDPLPPEAPYDRVSLNLSALMNSDAIMLLISGAEKKAILDAAIAGENDLPIARLLQNARGPITIFWSET